VLRKVESLGIAHVQGYLLGRPVPLAQLAASNIADRNAAAAHIA
jgi:EAL domain-containing protein (putative c-di-GMP-specific phosphodiesterase class I)